MRSIPTWLPFASVLMLALVLRLGGAWWWQSRLPADQPFYFGDSASYWELAGDVAAGRAYEYQGAKIFRTPGYPLGLAPLFLVWKTEPPILVARIWNAVLGTLVVGFVMVLARQQFTPRISFVAGLLAAVIPEAIAGSVFILSEAAFLPFMLGQLILATRARQVGCNRQGSLSAFGAGVCGGLGTLVRPSWLLFTIFHTLLLSCFRPEALAEEREEACDLPAGIRSTLPRRIILMTLPMLGLLLTMSPWWLRNYTLSGSFVPTTSEVGASLYDGLNPLADGSSNMEFKPKLEQEFSAADSTLPPDTYPAAREIRQDSFFRQRALSWAKENPHKVLQLAAIKFMRLWNIWPNASDFRSTAGRLVIAFTYGPVMLLALLGLGKFLPNADASRWLLVLPAVYLSALHMIFVSSLRYRLPALLPLLIFAAAAAVWYYDRCVLPNKSLHGKDVQK